MNELRYSLPLATKAAAPAGVVSGIASTFGPPPDLQNDVIVFGAFSDSLEAHRRDGSRVGMLHSHHQDWPVGRWDMLEEANVGLMVEGQLALGVEKADECLRLGQMDALAFSVGFRPLKQKSVGGVNYIEKADLAEISLVAVPANRRTRLQIKSLGGIVEYQQFLQHDCGLSVREAKALARDGWSAFRNDGSEELAVLADYFRKSANRFKGMKL